MLKFLQFLIREETEKSHVMTFMRANPPTAGHQKVVDKVTALANNKKASHSIILSHSHDGDKNPLTPEQKLKHAQRAFPDANVSTSSKEQPTLLHHASNLFRNGIQHLHLVAGQDRVGEFNKLLNDYNGKEGRHGHYNFKSITVHSAGDRDPDSEGVTGISGTKMRAAARSGDKKTFHAGASSHMTPAHKDEMMRDIVSSSKV